jgi:hypothetical protein
MKRLSRFMVSCSIFILLSCSGEGSKKASAKDDSSAKMKSKEQQTSSTVGMEIIATDVCDCVSDYENSLSDEAKQAIINAVTQGGMDTVWKNFSEKDRDNYFAEGKKTYNCLKALEKKHPFFTNYNKKSLAEFLKALEDNCSEFAAALMKTGPLE